ncbi:MAG: glycoside hydrolase 43 family protein [Oscillospiraceae bacterium]|nr:glycoside hydrolase 43 family protein [Oscillospiraceae bacterium]
MDLKIGAWGDMGDGSYRNPVLFADYSDPDCIRVGDDYWLICSEFNFMGMPVLHSRDLVNWELVNRVYTRLEGYDRIERYGEGSWAPALRFHDGVFYIYFCTPKDGLFMCRAENPRGEWSEPLCVSPTPGWEDPCPIWDDDGSAWLGRSRVGAGAIILHRMSPDGTRLLDEGRIIYEGPVAEGTKFYRHGGMYYLVIPEEGVPTGCETALRSRDILGPYERRVVLRQGDSWVNGPHQGALVDTPSGELWFLHFSSTGAAGRVVHLQPAAWKDGWPEIYGPVTRHKKPSLPVCGIRSPQTSDDFSSPRLGWQWQWNHNPDDSLWSLTERPGSLRLTGTAQTDVMKMPNVLTQRLTGACGLVRVRLDMSSAAEGQAAGIMLMGRQSYAVSAVKNGGCLTVGEKTVEGCELTLQLSMQYFTEVHSALLPPDGSPPVELGSGFMTPCVWKGSRIALFTGGGEGKVYFGDFTYIHDGPNGGAKQ